MELEDRFRANKEHLAHANSLATRYQDTKKKAIEAKKLADAANAKKVEAEESFKAALESLTKAEDKIWAYESDFKQVLQLSDCKRKCRLSRSNNFSEVRVSNHRDWWDKEHC